MVREWGITASLDWPAFARKMATAARTLGDTDREVAQYRRVRERQTRTAAATLVIAFAAAAVAGVPWPRSDEDSTVRSVDLAAAASDGRAAVGSDRRAVRRSARAE